jgi:putative ABC transport system substrate-binding protein
MKRLIQNLKRGGIFAVALTFALGRTVAEAQQPAKVPRIGYLSAVGAARDSTRAEAIRLALRELGYLEGQNIAIEYRSAGGKLNRYHKHATELVHLKVDIIVVAGGPYMSRPSRMRPRRFPSL